MNALSSIGISQSQQYFSSRYQNLNVQNRANEEASESPAQKVAEANGTKLNKLDVYA